MWSYISISCWCGVALPGRSDVTGRRRACLGESCDRPSPRGEGRSQDSPRQARRRPVTSDLPGNATPHQQEIEMYDHIGLKVKDVGAAARFYKAALAPLGYVMASQDESGAGFGPKGAP